MIKDFGAEVTFLLGARKDTDLLELDEFAKIGKVCITTEDGSAGEVGFVTNHSVLENEQFDMISTCGPKPMMVSVARLPRRLAWSARYRWRTRWRVAWAPASAAWRRPPRDTSASAPMVLSSTSNSLPGISNPSIYALRNVIDYYLI